MAPACHQKAHLGPGHSSSPVAVSQHTLAIWPIHHNTHLAEAMTTLQTAFLKTIYPNTTSLSLLMTTVFLSLFFCEQALGLAYTKMYFWIPYLMMPERTKMAWRFFWGFFICFFVLVGFVVVAGYSSVCWSPLISKANFGMTNTQQKATTMA